MSERDDPAAAATPREPSTEAGRTFLSALEALDRLTPGAAETPVGWAHGIVMVEDEARAQRDEELREAVEGLPWTELNLFAGDPVNAVIYREAVLALLAPEVKP